MRNWTQGTDDGIVVHTLGTDTNDCVTVVEADGGIFEVWGWNHIAGTFHNPPEWLDTELGQFGTLAEAKGRGEAEVSQWEDWDGRY